jgi:hypothetical protein
VSSSWNNSTAAERARAWFSGFFIPDGRDLFHISILSFENGMRRCCWVVYIDSRVLCGCIVNVIKEEIGLLCIWLRRILLRDDKRWRLLYIGPQIELAIGNNYIQGYIIIIYAWAIK